MDELYIRIKNTRREKGLTQDELAKAVGYTSRAMISQIEKGQINLPQSKIVEIAKALGVTPAYLVGFSDDENNPFRVQFEYIATLWAELNEEGRNELQKYAELLASNKKYAEMR